MSVYVKSGNSISTENRLEKLVKHNVSELIIYSYYNIENLNLLRLKNLLQEIKENLFFCPDLWAQPKYFSKTKLQVQRVYNYIEKK